VPEGSWPGVTPGAKVPAWVASVPLDARIVWDPDGETTDGDRDDASAVLIPLVARRTRVGAIHGYVEQRRVSEVVSREAALYGFATLVAMSLYNSQLQQQAQQKDREYRAWLDAQGTSESPELKAGVTPATLHRQIIRRLASGSARGPSSSTPIVVGESRAMREVTTHIRQVASSDSTVLLTGESGTGKELAANTIHSLSKRAKGPFVAVNCGAIPSGLLESELFGHERGAFTGANNARTGVFQRADGGTIFLDEIAEMDPSAQVRLLRVLQERTVTPVGGDKTMSVDVRIIAATHQDLSAAVSERRFREDLFYRLNVFPIHVPPLRERMEDLPDLLAILLHRISNRTGIAVTGVTQDAVERMVSYHWPGNVRELENCLERAVLLADGAAIQAEHLQFEVQRTGTRPTRPTDGDAGANGEPRTLAEIEKETIVQALKECDNNVSETARKLDITRDKLRYRMKKYNITVDR